ncbi:histidine phosphatase family protein [Paracoccaceae bacterium GXU_MW_L88]
MFHNSTSSLPKSLIFLRHARTPWNINGLTMGQSDISLSGIGKKEAEQAVRTLQEHPIDLIVSSPLSRCLMTISPFCRASDSEFIIDPKLAERAWGIYEGVPKWQRGENSTPKDGETDDDFRLRVTEALNALPIERNILLVSHSGVFREVCNLGYIHHSLAHAKLPHATPVVLRRTSKVNFRRKPLSNTT